MSYVNKEQQHMRSVSSKEEQYWFRSYTQVNYTCMYSHQSFRTCKKFDPSYVIAVSTQFLVSCNDPLNSWFLHKQKK